MLEQHLQDYFGFTTFKPGQQQVIQTVLNRQSAAAIFPTGAGKSLCYQLPAMLLPHMTLVVSPLLSLMKDQLDFLRAHNIPAARLDSTLSRDEYHAVVEQAKTGRLNILMIAVERFKNERFRSHLQQMQVSLLVVDEAHCISEWGHNFRPEYLKIPAYQEEFHIPHTLLLTATATEQVIEDMCRKLSVPPDNVTITGFYRENLFLQVTPTNEVEKDIKLLERIRENPTAPTIVYVTLQKTAEHVAHFLKQHGISAYPYHAGMKTEEREDIQNRFMQGTLNCVAATIAFGMGIDKQDIRRVIHYDLPKSIENYSQEIGRSGRDKQPSLCEVMANRDNLNVLENFIYGDTPERQSIHQLLTQIKQNPEFLWEMKLTALSNELNIRQLPLKTLLVYLDMEGIIRPKQSYFEEYSFKYHSPRDAIINRFHDERRDFVSAIFQHSYTKRTWTAVEIPDILQTYHTNRQRIITALEYFDEQGWIELQAKQSVEVYDIMTQAFDLDDLTDNMHGLFQSKESHEIQRIHNMVDFFESDSCLSTRLARYFGERLNNSACGHCSFCKSGKATLQRTIDLQPLSDFRFEEVSRDFMDIMGEHYSVHNLTKFLCGIYVPVFTKLKVKKLPHFGLFERYPFQDVKQWIESQ